MLYAPAPHDDITEAGSKLVEMLVVHAEGYLYTIRLLLAQHAEKVPLVAVVLAMVTVVSVKDLGGESEHGVVPVAVVVQVYLSTPGNCKGRGRARRRRQVFVLPHRCVAVSAPRRSSRRNGCGSWRSDCHGGLTSPVDLVVEVVVDANEQEFSFSRDAVGHNGNAELVANVRIEIT